ncbi:uncharacterized protein BDW47DRAFT_30479 [Aspergillus candidus]|uniref:Uncharacterized protein n=1 Tax=Aspergillus candidus TaxID=41067 RepID=A0A2I2FBL7_ASPCN|nr:hypothetical protein BDW47DRAFT_30479 [Aspergillus candidus]PLB37987.1 hypothetical protein BDW47DRAFT_30479 [Aspergillus candidus]
MPLQSPVLLIIPVFQAGYTCLNLPLLLPRRTDKRLSPCPAFLCRPCQGNLNSGQSRHTTLFPVS